MVHLSEPVTLHVVSHTHWDREWYLTHEQFRMRLVDLIDHLLALLAADPQFRYFHLDAQTIVLEDYLQIRPHMRGELERFIREGRILVGPWYQLNDEFLTSGESTIRSLLVGHRVAASFGPVMKVGYLPDQFGNISQMPQIFAGFGIDNCVFGRGFGLAPGRKMEFWWESPDGTRVIASLMALWYNNAQHIPADPQAGLPYIRRLKDAMLPHAATSHLLLMNGVDHLEAQTDLSAAIAAVSDALQPDKLIHSTLPAYVEAIKQQAQSLPVVAGELREDRHGSVLAGTLSTRIYLKQANERCQTLLERYAEPFCTWAWALGAQYPLDFLTYAWKLLMQNHPHDSICGCSIDQVHREMMPRFQRVQQVGEELFDRAIAHLTARVDTQAVETVASDGARVTNLVVLNPVAWQRTDHVEAVVDFPLGEPSRGEPTIDRSKDVTSITIRDDADDAVPATVLESRICYKRVLSPVELPMVMPVRRFRVAFVARDVPGLGYATFKVVGGKQPARPQPAHLLPTHATIENEFFRIRVNPNGTVWLMDKRIGAELRDLNLLESGGDVGDEYRYVPPLADTIVTSTGAHGTVSVEQTGPVTVCRVDFALRIPACALPDGSARSPETVECPVTTRILLAEGCRRLEFETTVHNNARDHRLRVLFPTTLSVWTSWAEGQFDVIERPLSPPAEWGPEASFSHPQQSWCDVSDGGVGLAVLNRGLPEYEVYSGRDRCVALTLLRCVGRLSGGGDAPGAELTPEAQCLGTHTFHYALAPHGGTWDAARVWRQAHSFVAPMRAVQTDDHDGDLPPAAAFVQLDPPELVLSAVKRAEDADLLVLRFYNVSAETVTGTANVRGMQRAWLANLNEEAGEELPVNGDAVELEVGPKKIATLLVQMGGGA